MRARFSIAVLVLAGCVTHTPFPELSTPPPLAGPVEFSLFLIGDAGEPAKEEEPVLRALSSELSRAAAGGAGTAVVFLGDNVYARGLSAAPVHERAELERRLEEQIRAVPSSSTAMFVPGNHDWDRSGARGLEAIQRQAAFIREKGADRAKLTPDAGCPGPVAHDFPGLRVIALDTQWWLHEHAKGASCFSAALYPEQVEAASLAELEKQLASAGDRHVVLVSHHPMLSSGSHGGYYPAHEYLYLGYPLIRYAFFNDQDLNGERYTRLRGKLRQVMSRHRPLLYAGGHEHTLELLRGDSAQYFAVSGAGIYGHVTFTETRPETIFKHAASGFMRLDVLRSGDAWLTVLEVDVEKTAEVFRHELR